MTRVFLISGNEEYFRTKLADFIEDKEIKDIKFSTTTYGSGYVKYSALVIYER